jgi:hypothetical protein
MKKIFSILVLFFVILNSQMVVGQTLYSENFDAMSNIVPLTTSSTPWKVTIITGGNASGDNNWSVYPACSPPSATKCLEMYNYTSDCYYSRLTAYNKIAWYGTAINATNYISIKLNFKWKAGGVGDLNDDYMKVVYSLDGTNWTDVTSTKYNNATTWQTVSNLSIPSACENTSFYIGFRWVNDADGAGDNISPCVDDISITGTLVSCTTNPSITTTVAASNIGATTASSGGQTISAGTNCSINAKGVCWKTSSGPVATDSHTSDGTGTANFTSSITGLSAQTLYYVRAYVTNGYSTAYGNEITFRTLSPELAVHPGSFSATAASSSQINLSFSAASTITNAYGYIILQRQGANPTGTPLDATGYSVGNTIGDGTVAAIITNTATTTTSITGLSPNTQYNFSIIPFSYDGTNSATYNYYTAATIKTANATTACSVLSGTYTVGSGGNFPTIEAAIAALKCGGVNGPVILSLTDASYTIGSAQTLTQITGTSATNTITFKPASGVSPTITFNAGSGGTMFKYSGADYIIFDGSNTTGGTTRDMTITLTGNNSSSHYSVFYFYDGSTSTYNTIKNCKINGQNKSYYQNFAIYSYVNSNITIQNNEIKNAYYGIYIEGTSTTYGENSIIKDNKIGSSSSSTSIGKCGIFVAYQTSLTVSGNEIFNIIVSDYTYSLYGLYSKNNDRNVIVTKNKVHDIVNSDAQASGAYIDGMYFEYTDNATNSGSPTIISNNFIWNISGYGGDASGGKARYSPFGICFELNTSGKTVCNINVYYNSIYLTPYNSLGSGMFTAGFAFDNDYGTMTINNFKNNIVRVSLGPASGTTGYAFYDTYATTSRFTNIDYNIYYVNGQASNYIGFTYGTQRDIVSWKSFTGQEANSLQQDPYFLSTSDLHITSGYGVTGASGTGVTTDIDGDNRTNMIVGADEIPVVICSDPTTQASNVTFGSVTSTSMTINWTRGNGDEVIVLLHNGSAVNANPTDGFVYNACNTSPVCGSQIGTGNYVVYIGTGTSVNVSGLAPHTTYYYQVYEKRCIGASTRYFTVSPPAGNQTTLCADPLTQSSNVTVNNPTYSSLTVNWTRGSTPGDGVTVLMHQGSAVDADPQDGTDYTVNNVNPWGSEIGTGNFVVYEGTGTSVTVSGLNSNTTYYFKVYEKNCIGTGSWYNTSSPPSGSGTTSTCSSLSGTVYVGSGQTYTSLTGVGGLFEKINSCGISSDLTVLITSSITETESIALSVNTTYHITIRPSGGGAWTITGCINDGPLVDFNGSDYVTIDGLNTGGNSLTITNTSTSGGAGNQTSTIRFRDDANHNTVTNCTILGSHCNADGYNYTGGVIVFDEGTTTGNNNNTISYCNIGPSAAGYPCVGILSQGNSTKNTSNTVDHCNIYDFYYSGTVHGITLAGIYLRRYNTDWTITNNRFYQTGLRDNYVTFYNIYINPEFDAYAGTNFQIKNNIIGYANSSGTGTTTLKSPETTCEFYGIHIQAKTGTAPVSVISGNTIANISATSFSHDHYYTFWGIYCVSGRVNIGSTSKGEGNIINNITGEFFGIYGIYTLSGQGANENDNIIMSNTISNLTTDCDDDAVNDGATICAIKIGNKSGSNYYPAAAQVKKNNIYGFGSTFNGDGSYPPSFYGIYFMGAGGTTNEVSNNMISINNGGAKNPYIYGYYDEANGSKSPTYFNVYHNTIYIGGEANYTKNTYAFYRNSNSTYNVKSNILSNNKTDGGSGNNYAVYVTLTGDYTCSRNALYTNDTYIGYYAANKTTLANWQASFSGCDANSTLTLNSFVNASTDLHLATTDDLAEFSTVTSISDDIDGEPRPANPTRPDRGADEDKNELPIELAYINANCHNSMARVNWATLSETNNDYFSIERSADAVNFEFCGFVQGAGNSNSLLEYSYVDNNPFSGLSYYKLKQTDFDGTSVEFGPIAVNCTDEIDNINIISTYINENNQIIIDLQATENCEHFSLCVMDAVGKQIAEVKKLAEPGINSISIPLEDASSGLYFLVIQSQTTLITKKMIVQ